MRRRPSTRLHRGELTLALNLGMLREHLAQERRSRPGQPGDADKGWIRHFFSLRSITPSEPLGDLDPRTHRARCAHEDRCGADPRRGRGLGAPLVGPRPGAPQARAVDDRRVGAGGPHVLIDGQVLGVEEGDCLPLPMPGRRSRRRSAVVWIPPSPGEGAHVIGSDRVGAARDHLL